MGGDVTKEDVLANNVVASEPDGSPAENVADEVRENPDLAPPPNVVAPHPDAE